MTSGGAGDDRASLFRTLPRHRFDAAGEIVKRATRWDGLVGCLLFVLIGVALLAAVAAFIATALMFDYHGEYLALGLVAVVVVASIPWVVQGIRSSRRSRAAIAAIACPHCGRSMSTDVDGATNVYLLLCESCRVVWVTPVHVPGGSDHHGHDNHHHHH